MLHVRPYEERHAIVELFVHEQGRVGVVARGVRSPRSRRRGLLQPFTPLLLSWRARGELGSLGAVEMNGAPLGLAGRRLISGLYLNELLMRLLRRDDPHPELYVAYDRTLRALVQGEPEADVLRLFERDLLEQVGYGLQLDVDVNGTPLMTDTLYDYDLEAGPRPMTGSRARVPVHGDSLRALARGELREDRQRREIKHLMRSALAPHLGGRPLKSRELYAQRVHRNGSKDNDDGCT